MKKILFLLLLLVSLARADIKSILIEPMSGEAAYSYKNEQGATINVSKIAPYFKLTVYGLLKDGQPKEFTTKGEDQAIITKFINDDNFNLSEFKVRTWVYFYEADELDGDGNVLHVKGAIRNVDFHTQVNGEFVRVDVKVDSIQTQSQANVLDVKAYVESK